MSTVKISNNTDFSTRKVVDSDYSGVSIKNVNRSAKASYPKRSTRVKNKVSNIAVISDQKIYVNPKEFLPFRIRLTTIGIESYGPGNPAPIGIAVIGISNYIL